MKVPPLRRRAAFTLVELLVVISIIAILVSLAIPNISRALGTADAAKCTSNLRNIGVGLLAFANDNNGDFPTAGAVVPHGSNDGQTGLRGWTEQLEPYMGTDLKVYRCVSAAKLHPESEVYSYFMGARAAFEANGEFSPLKLQRISKLSRYILGGDITDGGFTRDDADKDDYNTDAAFGGDVGKLHRGMANILFADGSVRPYKEFKPDEMEISYTDPDAHY